MTVNIQNLREWIKRKLGDPIVCVETSDEQIDMAVQDAFLWWSSYRGWYREETFNAIAGQVEYDLSAVDPVVSDVVKVFFTASLRIDLSNTWNGFLDINGYPYDQNAAQQGNIGFYSGLVQWLQQREIAARVLSVDKDWFFNQETKILSLAPEPQESGKVIYMYKTPFISDYLPLVPQAEQYLIRKRALAETKYTLGRIRGKYTGGLPAAQGNVSLDGADLIREAQDDFDKLDQELLALIPPPMFLIA